MIEAIRTHLDAITELCRRHRVRSLHLIGSAAGTDFDPSRSDIDFIVDFGDQERRGFDDVSFVMHEELVSLLGRPVDLLELHAIRNPVVKASIQLHKVKLYDAA